MEIIVITLIVLAIIIAIPIITALFVPNDYEVVREVVIKKSRGQIFDYIRFLKNQDFYNKWIMVDPEMEKSFIGEDGNEGFIYAWDSTNKNAGKGEQEIVKIKPNERIDIEIRFVKPFRNTGETFMTLESLSDHQTKLRWGMKGRNRFPFNLMNLMIDNLLGKDLEISLANLKMILERESKDVHHREVKH